MREKGLVYRVSLLIFIAVFFLAAFVTSATILINGKRTEIDRAVEQNMLVKAEADSLREQYQLTALAYRGYFAFGRDEFLQNAEEHKKQFLVMLDKVKQQIESRPSYREEKLQIYAKVVEAWNTYNQSLRVAVELKRQNKMAEIETISRERGTPALNDLLKNLDQLVSLYDKEVSGLLAEKGSFERWQDFIPLVILFGSAATGMILVRFLRRSVIEPLLTIEQAVTQIGHGEYVILPSNRHDELGKLEHGINFMTSQLQQRHQELATNNQQLVYQRDLLEAQNEEIVAQQVEQQETLQKLSEREQELEIIASYQEKLTGFSELQVFLDHAIPGLLQALDQDAAVVVLKEGHHERGGDYRVVYAAGYPENYFPRVEIELFGPAKRVFTEKQPFMRSRDLTEKERGVHDGYTLAFDQYHPLFDDSQAVIGFILLTSYNNNMDNQKKARLTKGLIRQLALALHAQLINEERRKQSLELAALNEELLQEKLTLQGQRDVTRQILEAALEGMVMCNRQGEILFVNRRMQQFFGLENVEGQTISSLGEQLKDSVTIKGSSKLHERVQEYLEGRTDSLNERFSFTNARGEVLHFELYASSVHNENPGNDSGYLFVFRDRTEEEEVDNLKNEFISIVSHELRTPLASVLGFLEILLHRDISVEKQKKYLQTVHKEALRLSNLINDFLDLQRMESGKQTYRLVPYDMNELVREVALQWQGKMTHEVRTHLPDQQVFAWIDRDRMTQVLHNLISNAIKYSPGASYVDVALRIEGEHLQIDVQDYGLGIPEENRDKLFTKFYRVDNTDRRQIGGTGLGLAIVKEIVESHRGSVTFTSELGAGSVFSVRLESYQPVDLSGKILVLEDNDSLGKLIVAALEKMGLPIVQMKTAEEAIVALERLEQESPRLCIVDIQLEGVKSGWDFITFLNRHPSHHATPVIVATVLEPPVGYHETETEKYLRKPFTMEWLLEVVAGLLEPIQDRPNFIFPIQDEIAITTSLEQQGMEVTDVKVKQDIIEVDVKPSDS